MIVYDVTMSEIAAAAKRAECWPKWAGSARDGNAPLSLKPAGARYRMLLEDDEAIVCWHGHERFLKELLTAHPQARVKTKLTTYTGFPSFLVQQGDVFEAYVEKYGADTCDCE